MSFPSIPSLIQDWNIDTLDKLIAYRDIESDVFDFKGELNELDQHLCAMANSGGGTLVLGVDEEKAANGYLIKFKKRGFNKGEENATENKIGNYIFQVEPNPKVEIKHVSDTNQKFYTVVKVLTEESKKPYMLKDRAQFYVRINGSSRPASRAVIFNLFSNARQRKTDVEVLLTATKFLKESFLHTVNGIQYIDTSNQVKVPPLELSTIRGAVVSAQWFIVENNIFGQVGERGGYTEGLTSTIYILERLNTYIHACNLEYAENTKRELISHLREWQKGYSSTERMVKFFDKVIEMCSNFLSKYP